MQLDHWQLRHRHSVRSSTSTVSTPAPSHEEALARLEYLVEARRRLGVLVGDGGVGKSLALRVARAARPQGGRGGVGRRLRQRHPRLAVAAGGRPRGCPARPPTCPTSGGSWPIASRKTGCSRQAPCCWSTMRARQGPDVITQLVRLARLDSTPAARWTIVFVGEPHKPRAGRKHSANRSTCGSNWSPGAKRTRSASCKRRSSKPAGSTRYSRTRRWRQSTT